MRKSSLHVQRFQYSAGARSTSMVLHHLPQSSPSASPSICRPHHHQQLPAARQPVDGETATASDSKSIHPSARSCARPCPRSITSIFHGSHSRWLPHHPAMALPSPSSTSDGDVPSSTATADPAPPTTVRTPSSPSSAVRLFLPQNPYPSIRRQQTSTVHRRSVAVQSPTRSPSQIRWHAPSFHPRSTHPSQHRRPPLPKPGQRLHTIQPTLLHLLHHQPTATTQWSDNPSASLLPEPTTPPDLHRQPNPTAMSRLQRPPRTISLHPPSASSRPANQPVACQPTINNPHLKVATCPYNTTSKANRPTSIRQNPSSTKYGRK
ncbi:hypothetical protein ACLOJK_010071 [Asimina triloba]